MRRRAAAFVVLPVVCGLFWGVIAPVTLARLTNTDTSTVALSTDTLSPPTSVAATGGTSVGLTWVASVDTYTAGYEIWRGVANGGPYSLVNTVTPGTATSASDSPGVGLFYYVLRSSFHNWRSVNSNQTSATVAIGPTATGYKACGNSAADTGGNGNGYETTPANACADGGGVAIDAMTGTSGRSTSCTNAANDRHRFRDFTLGIGTLTSVAGIEVRADVGMNNNGGTSRLCVELSWDGGTNWTTAKVLTLSGSAEATYTFGSTIDAWGHTWMLSELSNANFRVRLTDATNQPNKDYRLDYLAVQVTYLP